jgi:hypothetical protein
LSCRGRKQVINNSPLILRLQLMMVRKTSFRCIVTTGEESYRGRQRGRSRIKDPELQGWRNQVISESP